ncbi:MAG: hypothetical protein COB13_001360 [OCS116 cluster bacterium]|uniref:HMA domain-containing protein n=1 Tax=OCS116 cluster bacterium TaxID=2030921 RepID=A0A2A4YYN9_9PROT|nr:hypothetical protein [OCS116 cluster bacterium]
MKNLKAYILILTLSLLPLSFVTPAVAETVQVEFKVVDMQGLTDQYKVRKILSALEGIEKVILTDGDDIVFMVFEDELSSLFDIKTALAAQGYPVTEMKRL